MTVIQKFGVYFTLALTLHLMIFGAFGINLKDESELIKQKELPEIIKASVLDDKKIQQEANRLKDKEENKRIAQTKHQQKLETKRKKEQKLLREAKKQRQHEEKQAKVLAKKRQQQAVVEQQKLDQIKQQKVLEAARLAKIKQQKITEKKRLDDLYVAEKKRIDTAKKAELEQREQKRQAEEKKQQALIAEKQRKEAEIEAQRQKQIEAEKAESAKNQRTTQSVTAAIQQQVNSSWIRPLTSAKGLSCTIRVKLLPSGDVMDAQVIRGSGDNIFDQSAVNAVRKASPLPVPKSRTLFSKHFRAFTFNFNPK